MDVEGLLEGHWGVSCLLMRGCTIWSGTSCIWTHTSPFAQWRTITASYCIPVSPVKTMKVFEMNFNNLKFNSCDFLCAYDVISYGNQNLLFFLCLLNVLVMPGSCRVKSDSVCLFICAFTVLPAWWMETVPWEEAPDILHSGADRHRLRTTLLLLSDLLWGRGQPTGEIKAMFLLQGLVRGPGISAGVFVLTFFLPYYFLDLKKSKCQRP